MKCLSIILLLFVCFSCNKNDKHPAPLQVAAPTIILLKVDYLTHQFEGGKILSFPGNQSFVDSIPIAVYYHPPSDFGSIALTYAPTGDTLFYGGIIWMGKGEIVYPVFDPASTFSSGIAAARTPDSVQVQGIYPSGYFRRHSTSTIGQAWKGIENLHITAQALAGKGRIGLFLYQPSVGIGNPADWDYFWMLYLLPVG